MSLTNISVVDYVTSGGTVYQLLEYMQGAMKVGSWFNRLYYLLSQFKIFTYISLE